MGTLTDQIRSLGYVFMEDRPIRSVPVKDGFREINSLKVKAPNGQMMKIQCDESPTLFPGGLALKDGVLDGTLVDGLKTTCGEIYRDYYDLDDNAYSLLLYNYSSDTKAYLRAEKERIGLIDYKEDVPQSFFALDTYLTAQGNGEMDVGRYADGRYVVQSAQALFDDGLVLRMHFTRFPTHQDVEDALTIRKMERDFGLGRHREMFHCGDCGELKHWLDIPGTISEKLKNRLGHHCGCNG